MRWPGFVGPSYQSQSPLADVERCVNWYPEQVESQAGKARYVYYPTPGQQTFTTLPTAGARALFSMDGRTHGVMGNNVFELFADGTSALRGTVAQNSQPAQIAYNGRGGNQLLIASGGNGYCLDLGTNTLTQVLVGDCLQVGMIDTYFLAFGGTQYRLSELKDGSTWNAAKVVKRTVAPDPWVAMVVDGKRQLWLIGEQTGEVHYDTGSSSLTPFEPVPGAIFKYGTPARWSAIAVADSVMWLAQTSEGAGMVVRAQGYIPVRVSTHAVETAIASYLRTSRIDDAEALVYEDQGHVFYCLTFPSANATWVYDFVTQLWHERGTWNPPLSRFDRWHPRVHCYAFGKHLVGETNSIRIASLDITSGTEVDGSVIRRVRVAPGFAFEHQPIYYRSLEVYLQTGVGLATGQGSDPTVMLRTSNDGGQTWSSERTDSAGRMGDFRQRVVFMRLGRALDRVIEISVSDPVPWRVIDAYLEADLPQEAAAS